MSALLSKIQFIITIILLIAVSWLFYQNHQLRTTKHSPTTTAVSSTASQETNNTSEDLKPLPDAKIAFINVDALNDQYLYISDYVKVIKTKKQAIEAQLQSLMAQFQKDYEEFQQSVQAGIAPPAELEKQKKKLELQQKDIQNKQLQMDNLGLELQEKNEQLQKDVKEFLKKLNNGKYDYILSYSEAIPSIMYAGESFDITKQVVEGLNKEYLEKKGNKQ